MSFLPDPSKFQKLKALCVGWLCWGLTSQSTIFQSCRDGAIASWVINQYFRGVKCLAQGHNTAAVGFEPRTSRSGVRHSTTEPPRSPLCVNGLRVLFCKYVSVLLCCRNCAAVLWLVLGIQPAAAARVFCDCSTRALASSPLQMMSSSHCSWVTMRNASSGNSGPINFSSSSFASCFC